MIIGKDRLKTIMDILQGWYWEIDENNVYVYSGGRCKELLGVEPEYVLGKTIFDFMDDEEAIRIEKVLKQFRDERKDFTSLEHELINKNGSVITVESWCAPIFNNKGKFNGYVGIDYNVTERKKHEESLREHEKCLSAIIANISDAVIAVDSKGNIILLNQCAEDILGWRQTDVVGRTHDAIINLFDCNNNIMKSPLKQALETAEMVTIKDNTTLIAKKGKNIMVEGIASPVKLNGNIIGAVMVFRDVTMQKLVETELSKTQKLDAIGILAGGIAHDFNNVLTAVSGHVEIAKMLSHENKVVEHLEDALGACKKAKSITQQLLTFSKGGMPLPKPTSVSSVIKDTAKFILTGANVAIEYNIDENISAIDVDAEQISEVIQNIIINATQAMPDGGVIQLSAQNISTPFRDLCDNYVSPGKYVKISISDTGTGIPKEHLSKIFDPYFTTKSAGNGLGLSVAYSIIKKHGGCIYADSKLGHGSIFNIYLPSTDKKAEIISVKKPIRGTGRILFLDDEYSVRETGKALIESLGYIVDVARDGKSAVELYKKAFKDKKPFRAIVADLTIPGGMGGIEAIKEIKKVDQNVKAIVSSGYSTSNVMSEYRKYGFSGALRKPYDLAELSKALHDVT